MKINYREKIVQSEEMNSRCSQDSTTIL